MEKQLLILVRVLLFVASCVFNNSDDVLDSEPEIKGEITQIEEGHSSVLVEENPEITEPAKPGGQKIWFGLTEETEVFIRQEGNSLNNFETGSFKIGFMVEVWATGAIEQSYPAKGIAKRIVIIGE